MVKIIKTSLILLSFLLLGISLVPVTASAAAPKCAGYKNPEDPSSSEQGLIDCSKFPSTSGAYADDKCYLVVNNTNFADGKYDASEASCSDPRFAGSSPTGTAESGVEPDCKDTNVTRDNCKIVARLLGFINVLSALVGIVSVIMIAIWGIQYTIARDNPQMVASARLHLLQTVLAVIGYLFIYAFLQWIVPGGVF